MSGKTLAGYVQGELQVALKNVELVYFLKLFTFIRCPQIRLRIGGLGLGLEGL